MARELLELNAWAREAALAPEETKWGDPGWSSWNRYSPEWEVCEAVAALVQLVRSARLIETGVGQGYMTRRIAAAMPDEARLRCFESDDDLRAALEQLPFFAPDTAVDIAPVPTPTTADFAESVFTVLDSNFKFRVDELDAWWDAAPRRSFVFVHDVSNRHPEFTNHAKMRRHIQELGIPGTFFPNPRGSFLGQKPKERISG
jgi:hypothetical protein